MIEPDPRTTKTKRMLVAANETVEYCALHDVIRERTDGTDGTQTEVRVVAPALNSRLAHWLSDDDGARRIAAERLSGCLTQLDREGISATGQVGDGDPLLASLGTFVRLPFSGDSLAAPLATDMSAWELAQLGWVRFRADSKRSLRCRLGGEPATIGDESMLLGSEDNVAVISMFLGHSAPLAPPKGTLYGAGCTRR